MTRLRLLAFRVLATLLLSAITYALVKFSILAGGSGPVVASGAWTFAAWITLGVLWGDL